ncbi:hypothetical protein CJF30_00011217 [Rutstroemia sp. NJR-2017a BBW]|nr:hypothetical protein CJF30_00011217 [Rutstroemia sp. NJR-2017a BBW]
MGYKRKD